jgi:hypothetical protein
MESRINLKILPALGFLIAGSASSIFAQSAGPFGYGIELNGAGTGALHSGITTLYALDDGGTNRLVPPGSLATLDQTSWADGSTLSPVLNLGAFNPGAGDTLTLLGGAMLTYQNGGAVVSVSYLNYCVDPTGGPYNTFGPGIQLNLTTANVSGNTGDTLWSDESAAVNLLTGLTNGTYVLQTYGFAGSNLANGNNGNLFENNGGTNYGATFTVVSGPQSAVLNVNVSITGLAITWTTNVAAGVILQQNTNPATANWTTVSSGLSVTAGGLNQALVSPTASQQFYRLFMP